MPDLFPFKLGTEAGIGIALYWNGKMFAVFWPAEQSRDTECDA